jgi:hypothetical protein
MIMDYEYGMFTDFGNDAVHAIVRQALVLNLTWPQVYEELQDLARKFPKDFGEATDTEVRERVYDTLGFRTPFYC